jgi:pimeloyl-ACP methyl ester carboxylesterase
MRVAIDGLSVFANTGGEPHTPGAPTIVFIHGAAMDHTAWTLLARYWAKAGYNVAAIDLPGHGLSEGQPLTSIEQNAEFVAQLLTELDLLHDLVLVGHSMGSLIALECAAAISQTRVLAMLGTALPMAVSKPLLDAAQANDHSSIDMISLYGHSFGGQIGGNPIAGIHAQNFAERLMEQAAPGVMYTDLNACNEYQNGEATAQRVECTAGLILGELDLMTPARSGAALCELLPNGRVFTLPDCGHMMMTEKPEETHRALVELITGSRV